MSITALSEAQTDSNILLPATLRAPITLRRQHGWAERARWPHSAIEQDDARGFEGADYSDCYRDWLRVLGPLKPGCCRPDVRVRENSMLGGLVYSH